MVIVVRTSTLSFFFWQEEDEYIINEANVLFIKIQANFERMIILVEDRSACWELENSFP